MEIRRIFIDRLVGREAGVAFQGSFEIDALSQASEIFEIEQKAGCNSMKVVNVGLNAVQIGSEFSIDSIRLVRGMVAHLFNLALRQSGI